MGNERSWVLDFCDTLDRQAHALERTADSPGDYSTIEKRLLRAQANTKRGVANELRVEARKLRRG